MAFASCIKDTYSVTKKADRKKQKNDYYYKNAIII